MVSWLLSYERLMVVTAEIEFPKNFPVLPICHTSQAYRSLFYEHYSGGKHNMFWARANFVVGRKWTWYTCSWRSFKQASKHQKQRWNGFYPDADSAGNSLSAFARLSWRWMKLRGQTEYNTTKRKWTWQHWKTFWNSFVGVYSKVLRLKLVCGGSDICGPLTSERQEPSGVGDDKTHTR